MTEYNEISVFNGIYLEDSYVLGLEIGLAQTVVRMLFVLNEFHPDYCDPLPGEQYCYSDGRIVFSGYSEVRLRKIDAVPSIDADGEEDFGNIYYLRETGNLFEVAGDWGEMSIKDGNVGVVFN
ncbi:MAG: hypothetical protein KF756_06105 [Acidobacteria bacterium]|nr:hypothetical protein [Acidobacteriota bacterium]